MGAKVDVEITSPSVFANCIKVICACPLPAADTIGAAKDRSIKQKASSFKFFIFLPRNHVGASAY
jgi:hypothetical protein